MNELKEIVNRLESYRETAFEVLYANKTEDGIWELRVKKVQDEKKDSEEE